MKRDLELARRILEDVETHASFDEGWYELKIKDHPTDVLSYHVMLLHQAGLLQATDLSTHDGRRWFPMWLTWEGHEFLDAARDSSRWSKAVALVKTKTGGLTFDVLKAVLIDLAKRAVLG